VARRQLRQEFEQGLLMGIFAGYGDARTLGTASYGGRKVQLGTWADFVNSGGADALPPVMLMLTNEAGRFDAGVKSLGGRAVSDRMGPVAMIAATAKVNEYGCAVTASAFLEAFVAERPETLGEGMARLHRLVRGGDLPLLHSFAQGDPVGIREGHLRVFHILGDPAVRLRYAARLEMALGPGTPDLLEAGQAFTVSVRARGMAGGHAFVSVETDHASIAEPLEPVPAELTARAEARIRRENWERAHERALSRQQLEVAAGAFAVQCRAPNLPGLYYVKALVTRGTEAAFGALPVRVEAAREPRP
jgi:hypothetical protein